MDCMYNKQDSHMNTWDIKEHLDKIFTRMVWAGYPDIPKYHNVLFPCNTAVMSNKLQLFSRLCNWTSTSALKFKYQVIYLLCNY